MSVDSCTAFFFSTSYQLPIKKIQFDSQTDNLTNLLIWHLLLQVSHHQHYLCQWRPNHDSPHSCCCYWRKQFVHTRYHHHCLWTGYRDERSFEHGCFFPQMWCTSAETTILVMSDGMPVMNYTPMIRLRLWLKMATTWKPVWFLITGSVWDHSVHSLQRTVEYQIRYITVKCGEIISQISLPSLLDQMRGFFSFSLPALITVCSVYQQYCRRSSERICWLQNLNRIHCWSWRQGNQLPCQVEANHGSAREVAGSGGSQQYWEGCGTWKKGKMYKHKEELGTCRLPLWGCPPADQQTSVISSPPSNSIHLDETNGNTSATSYPPVLQPEVQHPCKENHPGRIHLYPVPEKNRITLTTSSQTLSTLFTSY